MNVYVVTRHEGAVNWLRDTLQQSEISVIPHLEGLRFQPGDKVCGILPIAWAARVCAQGAEAHILTIDLPPELRGRELTAQQLKDHGAKLIRYDVRELG